MIKKETYSSPRIHHLFHHDALVSPLPGAGNIAAVSGTVLVVDPGDTLYFNALCAGLPECRLILSPSLAVARDLFFRSSVDLVLLAHSCRHPTLELLNQFKSGKPSIPIVVLAETGSEALAIDVFRRGARDYFRMPLPLEEVGHTVRAILKFRHVVPGRSATGSGPSLEKALQFIHFHFKSPLSLPLVAEQSGMSLSSFVRRFKKKTGMTFIDFLNSLRISTARTLLADSGLTLLQVSMACGYNHQSHFNRIFKKFVGLTPGQYRKSIKSLKSSH